jgi:CMP-N,N'-diacetyllegionaminic acid synthase
MNVLALIPARGGSKSIPKKNIVPVGGKPLIVWTIEAAQKSSYINKIVVSSDSEEILSIGKSYGAEILKRPDHLASDTASYDSVVDHSIKELESFGYKPDLLICLQPTSPLRSADDIDRGVKILLDNEVARALVGVIKTDSKILKSFLIDENGFIKGVAGDDFPFMNRQELPQVFKPNGALYIIHREALKEGKLFVPGATIHYEMDIERSLDVDNPEDLEEIERYLKKIKK